MLEEREERRGDERIGMLISLTSAEFHLAIVQRFNFFPFYDGVKTISYILYTMGFWSNTAATPSFWQITGWSRLSANYIRSESIPFPAPKKNEYIVRLNASHTHRVAAFWQRYYSGEDWEFDDSVYSWARLYLSDTEVIILGLFHGGDLIATIVSTPVGPTTMSHGVTLSNLRVIEGLCVHDNYRSTGVAGFMIETMDAFTSRTGPVAHLWSREINHIPLISSALSTTTYAYARCGMCPLSVPVTPMNWSEFVELWTSNTSSFCSANIVVLSPNNRRGGLLAFAVKNYIVIVSNTGRRTKRGHLPISEVIWCGQRREHALLSARCTEEVLTSVAAYLYKGLLFASSAFGVERGWTHWNYGNSGYHAWYLYNYIPPAFGSCTLHAIREEI